MLAILEGEKLTIYTREIEVVQEITLKNKKDKVILFCLN